MKESLTHIFLDAFLINNFVLCVFLGMCSFLGLSGKFATAWRMGVSEGRGPWVLGGPPGGVL